MGRQINFFMMPGDVAELDTKVKELGFIIIAGKMSVKNLLFYNSLTDDFGKDKYLVLQSEIDLVVIQYSEFRKEYFIHPLLSPVIEFTQQLNYQNKLIDGRMYYESFCLEKNNERHEFSELFTKNAEKLFRWYKQKYKNNQHKNYYICPNTQKWLTENSGILAINGGAKQFIL